MMEQESEEISGIISEFKDEALGLGLILRWSLVALLLLHLLSWESGGTLEYNYPGSRPHVYKEILQMESRSLKIGDHLEWNNTAERMTVQRVA